MAKGNKKPLEWDKEATVLTGTLTKIYARKDGDWFAAQLARDDGSTLRICGVLEGAREGLKLENVRTKRATGQLGSTYYIESRATQQPKEVVPRAERTAATNHGDRGQAQPASERDQPVVPLKLYEGLPVAPDALKMHLTKFFAGVTEANADLMVETFGTGELLEALDSAPESFITARSALGKTMVGNLLMTWRQEPDRHRAAIALRSIGLTPDQADSALKRSEASNIGPREAARRICKHPYRLTMIDGIGFAAADQAAAALGVDPLSSDRILAATRHHLEDVNARNCGHTNMPLALLADNLCKELASLRKGQPPSAENLTPTRVIEVLQKIDQRREEIYFPQGTRDLASPVSLGKYVRAEADAAVRVAKLLHAPVSHRFKIPTIEESTATCGFTPEPRQLEAIEAGLTHKVMVLTGGPGCGKTSVSKAIVLPAHKAGARVRLIAPTGRAARRMNQAIGLPAETLHRALGAMGENRGFKHGPESPMDGDVFMCDEAGMNDALISARFFAAVPDYARVIIVGDHDQLPSVGAGAVLADLIYSDAVPVARLTVTKRRAADNPINVFARNIRDGVFDLPPDDGGKLRFSKIRSDRDIVNQILGSYMRLVDNGVALEDIAVLCPIRAGQCGVTNLNAVIQRAINKGAAEGGLRIGSDYGAPESRVAPGDRVMQMTNDYKMGVVNSDTGTVLRIDTGRKKAVVDFGLGEVEIAGEKLYNLRLSFAMTTHKSQGSEYDYVLMPMSSGHKRFQKRQLIYTATTRAKKELELSGDPDTLAQGINNAADYHRRTLFQSFLRHEMSKFEQFNREQQHNSRELARAIQRASTTLDLPSSMEM